MKTINNVLWNKMIFYKNYKPFSYGAIFYLNKEPDRYELRHIVEEKFEILASKLRKIFYDLF